MRRDLFLFFAMLFLATFLLPSPARSQVEYIDRGDFVLEFIKPGAAEYVNIEKILRSGSRFQGVVSSLNTDFIIPASVHIVFQDNGGPSYDPMQRRITLGYDFATSVYEMICSSEVLHRSEAVERTLDVLEYVLYFEIARALVDIWEAPLHAAQWESEKGLSVMLVSRETTGGDILSSVTSFLKMDPPGTFAEDMVWDEFSIGKERFVATLLFLYGWDPDTFSALAAEAGLSEETLAGAEGEYQLIADR